MDLVSGHGREKRCPLCTLWWQDSRWVSESETCLPLQPASGKTAPPRGSVNLCPAMSTRRYLLSGTTGSVATGRLPGERNSATQLHDQGSSWSSSACGLDLDGLEGRYECEVSAHPGPTKPIVRKELLLPRLLFWERRHLSKKDPCPLPFPGSHGPPPIGEKEEGGTWPGLRHSRFTPLWW